MTKAPGARVVLHELDSAVLTGNPLGDPARRTLAVVLPPGYDERPQQRWPLVVMLSGYTGTGVSFLNRSPWTPTLAERLAALCAAGAMRGVVLALPDCFTRLGGSQYMNSSGTGRYQDYLADEVVPFVEAAYRIADGARGVCGKSSGGYGALALAMRRPGLFRAAACHSGDMYFEYCYLPTFPKVASWFATRGAEPRLSDFFAEFDAAPKKRRELVEIMEIFAMAACYSPNPAVPHGFDLPFDLGTGELVAGVWERWLANDPVRMLADGRSALAGLALLYVDCGTRDEFHLHLGARILAKRLRELGIGHCHEEFADGHMDITYRYDVSLPLLDAALWKGIA